MAYYAGITEEAVEMERRVYPAHEKVPLRITPRGKHYRRFEGKWRVTMVPMEISANSFMDPEMNAAGEGYYDSFTLTPENGELVFDYVFKDEEEWAVVLSSLEDEKLKLTLHVYSLEADLFARSPYIGDLHTHSCFSDGDEEPVLVAANHRKAGYDFIALTDHHQYAPSVELEAYLAPLPVEFRVFRGEEVHLKSAQYMHVVNFGSRYSVNDLHNADIAKADSEVRALMPTLDVPPTLDQYEAAYRVWTAERIREAGGMAIIAHPFWRTRHEYNMRPEMVKWLFEKGYYDAFEVISGQSVFENNLQTALYGDMRSEGTKVPVVGSSDCHKSSDPGTYFKFGMTFAFAEELTAESVIDAVKNHFSAAMETANGRIYGTYRMVKYALFLKKYYLPHHDELCIEEGLRLAAYYKDETDPEEAFGGTCGRVAEYLGRFMGKE